MKGLDYTGIALVVTALGTVITATGIAIVAVMTARQQKILNQVEKQGNSVALEQKRVTAAALRTVATVTKLPEDELKARDAETLYQEAKEQAQLNTK